MTDKLYIDANIIVSFVIKNHIGHIISEKILKEVETDKYIGYISILSIDECLHTLYKKYKLPKNKIEVLLYNILNIKNIRTVQTPRIRLRKYINIWHITNLKPRDAAHLYLMRINEIKYIATSDKHFIKNQKSLEIKVI